MTQFNMLICGPILVNSITYTKWPFSNTLQEIELIEREVLDVLDRLDSDLDFEEWAMDQEAA